MNQRSFCVSLQDQRICWQPVNQFAVKKGFGFKTNFHFVCRISQQQREIKENCLPFMAICSRKFLWPWPEAKLSELISTLHIPGYGHRWIDGSITRWWHWTPNEPGSIWGLEVKKLNKSKLGKSFFSKWTSNAKDLMWESYSTTWTT